MDAAGRRSIRRAVDGRDLEIQVVAPTFLFYVLYDTERISRQTFCEACEKLFVREGWTGYQAVKAAWEGIPVDCSDTVEEGLLPEPMGRRTTTFEQE